MWGCLIDGDKRGCRQVRSTGGLVARILTHAWFKRCDGIKMPNTTGVARNRPSHSEVLLDDTPQGRYRENQYTLFFYF
jgi:hypothetical protein